MGLGALDAPCIQCGGEAPGRRQLCSLCRVANEAAAYQVKRDREYRARYGIGLDDYLALERQQGGRCAVCRGLPKHGRAKGLFVDHDHETGKVRGLLCSRCNHAEGLLDGDPDRMRALAAYVEAHRGS